MQSCGAGGGCEGRVGVFGEEEVDEWVGGGGVFQGGGDHEGRPACSILVVCLVSATFSGLKLMRHGILGHPGQSLCDRRGCRLWGGGCKMRPSG